MILRKNRIIITSFILLSAVLVACGGGDSAPAPTDPGGDESGSLTGTITLTGSDTASVGTILNMASYKITLATDANPADNLFLTGTNDLGETFALNVTNTLSGTKSISMGIQVGPGKENFGCTSLVVVFTDCGDGINLDIANKMLTLTDVTTSNTKIGNILTLNGTLKW